MQDPTSTFNIPLPISTLWDPSQLFSGPLFKNTTYRQINFKLKRYPAQNPQLPRKKPTPTPFVSGNKQISYILNKMYLISQPPSEINSTLTMTLTLYGTAFRKKLIAAMDTHVPTKTTSRKIHQPWITTQTKLLLRQKQRWFQIANRPMLEKVQKHKNLTQKS